MCTICQVSETSRELIPRSDNASLSLTIDSKLALFSAQNTTQGISISITPLCTNAPCSTPEAITIDNVFLPTQCSLAPCDAHMLFKKEMLNESFVQYLIGVPANQSMVLLRFLYETTLQLFKMVERVVVNQGITDCSPTSVVQLNEQYYTLCVNEVNTNLQILRIDSLDDLSQVSFNPVTNKQMALPITGISVLDYIQFSVVRLLLANGPILTIVNVELFEKSPSSITECVGIIHQLKLRNNTDIDSTIPYLLYCETNYVLLDTWSSDDPIVISSHYYNETGYPVICTNENDSTVAEIFAIIKSDFNSTIHYGGNKIIIPGQAIDLETSACFGIEEKLFYLYSDSKLGAFLVNLETGKWSFLSSPSAIRTKPQVFDNHYILLEEVFSASNVTLRMFDVLVQDFVVANVDHTSNFVRLIQFLLPQQKTAEGLTTEHKLFIGIGVIVILFLIVVPTIIVIWYVSRILL